MKAILFCHFLLLSLLLRAESDVYHKVEDKTIFDNYINVSREWKNLGYEELVMKTATYFLGTPYVASTLEMEPERLVVNLREFDCTTFVESVYALSKTAISDSPTFETFCCNLKMLRYRNSVIDGYESRLHYASDWIFENERKGLFKNTTKDAGGKELLFDLSFMSTHPDSYKQLKNNHFLIDKTREKEKEINKRSYHYIPECSINALSEKDVKNGDAVWFTTSIVGLDISHVGIVCWVDGVLTFIHASSSKKKVVVNEGCMQSYIQAVKRNTGAIFVSPIIGSLK